MRVEEVEESVVELLDELCMLEELRMQRTLEPEEARRWVELQRSLSRAMCEEGIPDERRAYLRVTTPLTVRVVSAGMTFDATAIDLGAGGMGLKSDVLPTVHEKLQLAYARTPSGEQFELGLPAAVVWVRKSQHELGAGFGVAFAPENRTQDGFVAELLLSLLRREQAKRG